MFVEQTFSLFLDDFILKFYVMNHRYYYKIKFYIIDFLYDVICISNEIYIYFEREANFLRKQEKFYGLFFLRLFFAFSSFFDTIIFTCCFKVVSSKLLLLKRLKSPQHPLVLQHKWSFSLGRYFPIKCLVLIQFHLSLTI